MYFDAKKNEAKLSQSSFRRSVIYWIGLMQQICAKWIMRIMYGVNHDNGHTSTTNYTSSSINKTR